MPFFIGVYGPRGAGKTTVCKILQSLGAEYIAADEIVNELYKPERIGWQKIKQMLGENFVTRSGVDRKKLRKFVLKDPRKMQILNHVIHPLVRAELNKKIDQFKQAKFICIEALFLEDRKLKQQMNILIFVTADREILLQRESLWHPEERDALFEYQKYEPEAFDMVIENNGTLEELQEKTKKLFSFAASAQ